jgi:GR25 family glycosyltransferase involved in LPS biosynthesis
MECHVINLDRTIDNFYKQRPYLIEAGLFPKRFKGVDSKKDEHLKLLDNLTNTCKDSCPDGLVGCGLSHILLARKLYDQGVHAALILEDDAYPLVPDLNLAIKKIISETPNNWDIIKLHCDYCQNGSNVPTGGSAAAYIINRNGLEKFSKIKLDWHIDLQMLMDPNLNIYKSKENIFWTDENTSDNRESVNIIGKIFNTTGEKTIDQLLSYKVFKIFGHEITAWEIVLFIIFVSIYQMF